MGDYLLDFLDVLGANSPLAADAVPSIQGAAVLAAEEFKAGRLNQAETYSLVVSALRHAEIFERLDALVDRVAAIDERLTQLTAETASRARTCGPDQFLGGIR